MEVPWRIRLLVDADVPFVDGRPIPRQTGEICVVGSAFSQIPRARAIDMVERGEAFWHGGWTTADLGLPTIPEIRSGVFEYHEPPGMADLPPGMADLPPGMLDFP